MYDEDFCHTKYVEIVQLEPTLTLILPLDVNLVKKEHLQTRSEAVAVHHVQKEHSRTIREAPPAQSVNLVSQ